MYPRTLFRGAKTGKKGMFLVILTNFGKDMTHKLRITHAKTRIKRLFSYLKYKWLPGYFSYALSDDEANERTNSRDFFVFHK